MYNSLVSQPDAVSVQSVLVQPGQNTLSEQADFKSLFADATTVTKARFCNLQLVHGSMYSLHQS